MLSIFKWFFGVVGAFILLYILVVVVKTVVGATFVSTAQTTNNSTSGNVIGSTTASVTKAVINFSFVEWAKNFHPFQFAPLYVGYDNGNSLSNSFAAGAPGNLTQNQLYWQGLNDAPNTHPTDWAPAGNAYNLDQANPNTQNSNSNNLPTGDNKYIKVYVNNNSEIYNNKIISGSADYRVFTNRTFPIMILDANQKVVGQVTAFPNGDIQPNGFVPFRAVLNFSVPASLNGYLYLTNQNSQEVGFNALTVVPIFFGISNQSHYRQFNPYYNSQNQMPQMLYSSPQN